MSEETTTTAKPDSYSVKTTTDVTERVQELTKKTGLNHKDLFAAMVTRYYSELESGSDLDRSDDMQQIRYHLNRAENIFLGSLQKVQDLKRDFSEHLETQKAQHKEKQEDLQAKNSNITKELEKRSTAQSELENRLQETLARNQELEDTNRTNRVTVDLLGQKLENLEQKAAAVDPLKAKITELRGQTSSYQQIIANLQAELGIAQQTITNLEERRTKAEETALKHEEEVRTTYEKTIQQLQEVHSLEVDKTLLESERRVLEMMQKIKEDYGQKVEDLLVKNDALRTKYQELTEKIYILELERLRLDNQSQATKHPTTD
ncbi:hypothetical protein [Desulfosporosinus sp. Sb-LF]|uniref:hypothetical protein n=1 Tax=Desulfosporosinus sp. Sb-LF TaxID=2560027 RepID=UPI00107EF7B8|nr:hypothetical protein [Desulfosporosinus sp. Sb-LF]TGE33277.1 hypothetical protein E4K68_07205 [Desulfosporosinus sp. Sb-LF]